MKILSIETSCDDTGIAVLEILKEKPIVPEDFKILSSLIASQIEVHQKYGGVFPAMAKREHQKNILPTFINALKEAKLLNLKKNDNNDIDFISVEKILEREPELKKQLIPFLKKYEKPNIDLISVTNGPGLEPCLWVGVNFAKCISYVWNIPVVPTNHIESHILINFLENKKISFPAISLVVSGGHTQITLVEKIGKYKILGETRDDAAGECFDKCAKILGLGYPGGPIISKLAETAKIPSKNSGQAKIILPRPMIGTKDYDFSFSGLKTAVLYKWQDMVKEDPPATLRATMRAGMSAGVQQAIIDVLIKKTIKAVKDYNAKSLILGGGVSANQELRKQFKDKLEKESPNTSFFVPKPNLSTDNGLMVAITGFYNRKKTRNWENIVADGNLRIS